MGLTSQLDATAAPHFEAEKEANTRRRGLWQASVHSAGLFWTINFSLLMVTNGITHFARKSKVLSTKYAPFE